MRLALVTPGFCADERDWCIPALTGLVRELARVHDVQLFALRYPSRRRSYSAFSAHVNALGGTRGGALGRFSLLARALAALHREHVRAPFDVIHGLWADESGFLAATAGSALGVPVVVSLLGGELVGLRDIGYGTHLSPAGRTLVRRALRRAGAVTVGSRVMESLASPFVPAGRLWPLPLGVDTNLFHPGVCDDAPIHLTGAPSLLHVASLVPVKDQRTLLRAFARVVTTLPGSHLHIVGDGPLRPELEALAGKLGVFSHVTLHGAVAHDRLPTYYRAADVAVLSSRFESQSMVALEAAACGRATVGTAVGVLPELVGEGLTVRIGDQHALAAAVVALACDKTRRTRLGERCAHIASSRYALATTVHQLTTLYTHLLEDTARYPATSVATASRGPRA